MEKVILMCREPGDHSHTVSLIEALFPECTVEIVMQPGDNLEAIIGPIESMGSSFQIVPFLGNY
jgi:hypothetical protein